ncbi:MAG: hypothetical protein ACREWG_17915 [Gammaproteobacteria bacterium]
MKPLAIAPLFVPDEALLPLLAIAGVLMILGLKRFAGIVVLFVLTMALSPMLEPFLGALIAALPGWTLVVFLVGLGFALLRACVGLVFGKGVADQMLGTLLADVVRVLVLLPFRGFRALLRYLLNGGN